MASNPNTVDLYEFLIDFIEQDAAQSREKPASRDAKHDLRAAKVKTAGVVCTVCHDEVPIGKLVRVMTCGHSFHDDCLQQWLASNNTCPNCRSELPAERTHHDHLASAKKVQNKPPPRGMFS
eukprot:Selendium_serpulae@DN749_c0_g1_i1.p4